MDTCVVHWRQLRYVVECTPSSLLSIAVKIAEVERLNYHIVYKQIINDLEGGYRDAKRVVEDLFSAKFENF